jgi:pantothenate kinase
MHDLTFRWYNNKTISQKDQLSFHHCTWHTDLDMIHEWYNTRWHNNNKTISRKDQLSFHHCNYYQLNKSETINLIDNKFKTWHNDLDMIHEWYNFRWHNNNKTISRKDQLSFHRYNYYRLNKTETSNWI